MSSPLAPATSHVQPAGEGHTCDSVEGALNQGVCLTQSLGQMLGSEQSLMEMTEIEYAHIQCLLQGHLEKQGEKTPVSHGDVQGYLLVRLGGENGTSGSPSSSGRPTPRQSASAARVCAEKVSDTDAPRPETITPAGHGFLTAVGQEAVLYLQEQSSVKAVRDEHLETMRLYPQMVEPKKRQRRAAPKSFSLLQENVAPDECHAVKSKKLEATPAASGECARSYCSRHSAAESRTSRPCMSLSQRKERHNRREKERRKSIRFFCDALNLLVPFCNTDTDTLSTLRLTTAFLTYIYNKHGEAFKEEFQEAHSTGAAPPP